MEQTPQRIPVNIEDQMRGSFMDYALPRAIDFPRQALHSHRLAFRHPITNQLLSFEAALPSDMADLVARLRIQTPASGV